MNNSVVNRKTISYAYLSQVRVSSADLFGGIVSIFKPIAKELEGQVFCPEVFSNKVKDLYGLDLHPWAAEDLIPRLVKHDVLYDSGSVKGVAQYKYKEIGVEFNDIDESDIEKVNIEFLSFSKPILKNLGVSIGDEDLIEGFYERLVDGDFLLVAVSPDEVGDDREIKDAIRIKEKINLLSASFVLNAFHKDKDLYGLILNVVSGAMVAEVVLNFSEPAEQVDLGRLSVFLDTPLLMAYMNMSSEKEKGFAKKFVESLTDKGASIKVFDHSVDELSDNLKAVLLSYERREAWGATARRLNNPAFRQYVDEVRKDVGAAVKRNDIAISAGMTSLASEKLFSKDYESEFYSKLGPYQNELARERDAMSLAMLMRYRNGRHVHVRDLSKLSSVFVTDNVSFANSAREFLVRKELIEKDEFPPIVSARYLAGLLWVFFGGGDSEIPKNALLANCAATLEPGSEILKKVVGFLKGMDGDQAELFSQLMGKERAAQYLMQYSLGDLHLINEENSLDLLDKVQRSLIESHEEKMKDEIKAREELHRLDLEKRIEEHERKSEAAISEIERKRAESEGKRRDLETEVLIKDASVRMLREEVDNNNVALNEIKDLYQKERMERLGALVSSLRWPVKRFEIFLTLMVALLVFYFTNVIAASKLDFLWGYFVSGSIFFLILLTTWKMPNFILGGLASKYRFWLYRSRLNQFAITYQDDFEVDLAKGVVVEKNNGQGYQQQQQQQDTQ